MRGWSWLQSTLSQVFGFGIIQTPLGTSPVATTNNDTLNFTSSDGSVIITGNSATKTINLRATALSTFASISTSTSAASGTIYLCDSTAASFNITLPAPALGAIVGVKDIGGAFETFPVTVIRNGTEKIELIAASYLCFASYGYFIFESNGTDWFLL